MTQLRGYIFSREFLGERVPQAVQNLVLRDYCQRIGAQYLLSASEYAMQDCHLILEQLLDEIDSVDGIVAYSLFQLPADSSARLRVLTRIFAAGKELHLALEGFSIRSESQIQRVEDIWRVKQTLPECAAADDLSAYAGTTIFSRL
ncbi:MAG TPA: LIC12192 family sporadic carbohydrate cluster protein [Rhodocyclaceae bacterium]|nr:LIC12192 family sporadic carbohydrate cluster protein [Rhodocyclaceae bacterium]